MAAQKQSSGLNVPRGVVNGTIRTAYRQFTDTCLIALLIINVLHVRKTQENKIIQIYLNITMILCNFFPTLI